MKHTNGCDKDCIGMAGIDLYMTKKQTEITDLLLAFAAQISKKAVTAEYLRVPAGS